MWQSGQEILLAISCSIALCLHEPQTQNWVSNIGRPETMHGANFVSQLGQFVNHSVILVAHCGHSPFNAGFLSFGWWLKFKNFSLNLFCYLTYYYENIWKASASKSFFSLSEISLLDSSLMNALEAMLYEPFPHAHKAIKL